MHIYIDQNILGYVSAGTFQPKPRDEVSWTYSDAHFEEIERGGRSELLDALDEIDAAKLEVIRDQKFRMQNQAILKRGTARNFYDQYLESKKEVSFDTTFLTDLVARLSGAQDDSLTSGISLRVAAELEVVLAEFGNAGLALVEDAKKEWKILEDWLDNCAGEIPVPKDFRKLLSTDKGRANALETSDDPVSALWEYLDLPSKEKLTAQEYFGSL